MDIASLNKKFGFGKELGFKEIAAGITAIEVDTALATASISLMGGQVLTWHPKSQQEPVLWVSKLAQYIPRKAIRGGVPICWPWFGAHSSDNRFPGHGFARVFPWDVVSTSIDPSGIVEVQLSLSESDSVTELRPADWPVQVKLSVRIRIGEELEIALITENKSDKDIVLTEGLHTYFNVSDIAFVRVMGLHQTEYVDLTNSNLRRRQSGPIIFEGELGRIFINCNSNSIIEDPVFCRRIKVIGKGNNSIAVWNPGFENATKIQDLGSEGWRNMVCVETANALENSVIVKSNQMHTMSANYSVSQFK